MAGRARRCTCRRSPASYRRGRVVNAYARFGTPSKWTVVGEICLDCGAFTFHKPDLAKHR